MCPNLDLSILGCVKVKVLQTVCRFVVAGSKVKKPIVTESRFGFLAVIVGKEGNESVYIFSHYVCLMIVNSIF